MRRKALIFFLVVVLISPGFAQSASGGNPTQEIQAALGARDYARALELANAQLRNFPRDAKLWTLQGIAFTGLGDNRRALQAYDKALGISPDYSCARRRGRVGVQGRQHPRHFPSEPHSPAAAERSHQPCHVGGAGL
jgi:tetratricopeptide (TPR) repeat protein